MNPNDEAQKTQRGRSRAYPIIALADALEKAKNINSNLGTSGRFNRESIVVGMGYKSLNGNSSRIVAALVQYGLLDRSKDLYYLSDLAKKYLLPVEDYDQEGVIKESALAPSLFSDIYETFKGQVMPKQFVNRLIHEFRIEQKVANDVERVFKATMETAGILQPNGILKSDLNDKPAPSLADNADQGGENVEQESLKPTPVGYLSVELPSGILVSYSQELASEFAFGTFGGELKALNEAVAQHLRNPVQTFEKKEEDM